MDGIVVVNKEKNYTSRDVVNIISKVYNTKKVGHTGTLDPLAEGVLIVCLNRALKVSEFITSDDKEYLATVVLGIETDTLDIEGNVVYSSNKKVCREDIENVLKKFIGKIKQEVPLYSAVKVNGKKLYQYAREKKEVKLPVKEVVVYNLKLASDLFCYDKKIAFQIKCLVSKGCYIRSLIRDIGRSLGTYGTMVDLIRTKQAGIPVSLASKIDDIKNGKNKVYKIEDIIKLPKVIVPDVFLIKIKNGAVVDSFFDEERVFVTNKDGSIIAIYEKNNIDSKCHLVKMINNQ